GFAGKVPEEELREPDGTPSGLWGPTEGSGPLLNGLAGDTWTVELWLNLSSIGSGVSIIDLGWAYDPGFSLTLSPGSFVLVNNYAGVQATCPTGLSTGAWHHVAFTREGSTVRHFVDGVEQAAPTVSSVSVQPIPDLQVPLDREHEHRGFDTMDFEERRQNRFNFAVGTDRHASNSASGMIDEMRISDVVRYSGSFTPECFSRNYGPGALEPSVANGLPLLFDPGPVSIPLELGGRKHVFIDDAIIDTMSSLQMTMNQPYGKEGIIKDFSIEKSAWRPSVFDVNGVVYLAMPEGYSSNTGTTYLATSADGLSFTMQEPIIIDAPLYGSFFKDLNPNVHAEEQYKVNAFVGNRGMYFYVSADGVNWRRNETIQLALRSGGEGECFWDDQRGRYASYLKRDSSFDDDDGECADASGRVAPGFWSDEILKAWPFYHMVTPYFEGYPFPSVTCEGPVEFYATGAGEVYRTRAIKYPWAPDVYLSFLWRYPGDDGPRHVDLGISRDGENWSFFGTNWYIPLGSEEEELSLYGLIRRGDEIWQYVDEGGAHGGSDPRYYYRYKQRLDGFVSLDAGGSTGTATTLPMVFEGRKLVLNIAATGSARVAILDEGGTAIPGFDLTDCDTIQADSVEHVVKWNGNSNVSSLEGTAVRLRFEMQDTKLYAFEFTSLVGPELASNPHPADGANDVDLNVALSWSPGQGAVSHDVYLGTDFNDVSNADDSNHANVDYNNVDVNSFDPGPLELGKTYYWRVDEVNDGSTFEGDVWNFTVSQYIVLDDMEAYNDDAHMADTWQADSYPDANNGARQKSMEFMFYVDWGTYFTAARTYSTAQDWTAAGVHHLSLWFYGYEYNLADDQMYVMLKDGNAQSATVPYNGDPNNIALEQWQEWNIPLQDFNDAGVNVGDVCEIVLGAESLYWAGILYFDDIRLYLPRCIPDFRPGGDITGDCFVDFRDVTALAGQWLDTPGSPSADIAPDPLDNFVDLYDLAVVVEDWLEGLLYP
ncbi:MAG: LamG domain-containing protein, partial [Planctomycetota bacterium]